MAIDPVCGMTVDKTSAACSHVHEGETYYFCSTHCRAKFETDPAGYLKRTETLTPLKHTNGKEPRNIPYMIWSGLTLLTCPCCIPLWIILLSGTAAGALLSKNLYVTVAVFLVLFLFSAWRALRSYNRNKIPN